VGQLIGRRTSVTDKRAKAGDEPDLLTIGGNPWRGNLGRGSRMKQAGKVQGGVSRRGCAKHRGRNVGSAGSLSISGLPVLMSRWRLETPWEVLGACARRAGWIGWNSEEEVSPGEDEPALAKAGGR